jgi:hypothetical protein
MNITHYPVPFFAVTFIALSLGAWFGAVLLRRRGELEDEARPDLSLILTATLALFGLIIGFSFSMAVSRYDQRKNYEEAEANAIGTEYIRADLLPADSADRVRTLLKSYLDQRILLYGTKDEAELAEVHSRTTQLQDDLWSAVRAPAAANPTPIVALAVSGMNDVLNSQGYTLAAYRNRIPAAAWTLLAAIALCCNVLVGWGLQSHRREKRLLVILPIVSALAFMLIADIDTPRHGIIRVEPQNLTSLAETMGTR